MNTTYSITKDVLVLDGNQMFVTYGIKASNENGEQISEIRDVSVNKSFTEKVINLLNDCKVEPCHFSEVVTDELNR